MQRKIDQLKCKKQKFYAGKNDGMFRVNRNMSYDLRACDV